MPEDMEEEKEGESVDEESLLSWSLSINGCSVILLFWFKLGCVVSSYIFSWDIAEFLHSGESYIHPSVSFSSASKGSEYTGSSVS